MPNDYKELENLSEQEKAAVLKILKEISNNGHSESMNKILYSDYDEIPVDIHTFLHDLKYLGRGLTDDEGRFTLFPYWESLLEEIFPDPLKPAKYNTLALTGSIGIGKSTEAVIIGIYELYRMLCLKDPYIYYGLQPIDLITFAVMNITMDAAQGVAWNKLQNLIQSSDWFLERGTLSKGDVPEWKPPKGIELIYGSQTRHIIGRAVFWSFFDEISFIPNQDVEKQKIKARELVNAAAARMQSRFMRNNINPTILVLASSKRTEQSFMETWIEAKKKQDSKTVKVVDEPQWVIRPDKQSREIFKVAIGNKFLDSEVIPLNTPERLLDLYRNRGYTLIDVPIGYYENFLDDINIALTDIAGISTSNVSRYFSGPRIATVKNNNLKNLMTKEIIEVGNGKDDQLQYYDFVDIEVLENLGEIKYKPLYIHLDMSLSGDKTGIAGVWITGKKPTEPGQPSNKDLSYRLAFNFSVKAPKGYQISFEKNRQFIRWLKQNSFNIKGISYDTYQSADLGQTLISEGYNCTTISVDRIDSASKTCLPYLTFRNAMYEERFVMYDNKLLTDELLGLERDGNGKIDHSPSGINCLTGDTKISLTDGRELSILDLKKEFDLGKQNYVYSFNENSKIIEPKPIQAVFKSGENAALIEVELDDGGIIKCTPEHRFMLRNGTYVEAQNLKENDSLMPLYRKYPSKGLSNYRLYYEPFEDAWHFEHRRFAEEILDEKYLVHHKDCNPKNNNPSNLVWCSKAKHIQIHSELSTGASSPEANRKRSNSVKEFHNSNKDTLEYWVRFYPGCTPEEAFNKHLENQARYALEEQNKLNKILAINNLFGIDYESLSSKDKKSYMSKYNNYIRGFDIFTDRKSLVKAKRQAAEKYFNVDYNQLTEHERRSYSIRYARIIDPSYQERVSKTVSNNHKLGKYKNAYSALNECNYNRKGKKYSEEQKAAMRIKKLNNGTLYPNEEVRLKQSLITSNRIWYNNGIKNIYIDKDAEIPEGFIHGRIKTWKNHKVKAIRFLDYKEDVYDLTIQDNHNFALSVGVFVHNSKDCADAVCGALYNASQHADEYAYEFGEDLNSIVNANANRDYENLQQLTVDFEQELMKLQDPLRKQTEQAVEQFNNYGLGSATPNFYTPYNNANDIIFI